MAWKTGKNSPLGISNPYGSPAGFPDTTPQVPVGTVAIFEDEVMGYGEFIYLPGVASTVAGDIVVYDLTPGSPSTTRLANNAQNNTGRPVAFALGATLAGQYGWYQIGGCGICNAIGGTVAGAMMANATTGSVANTADAGDQILGARILTAVGTPSAGKSYMQISRPHVQGQIT